MDGIPGISGDNGTSIDGSPGVKGERGDDGIDGIPGTPGAQVYNELQQIITYHNNIDQTINTVLVRSPRKPLVTTTHVLMF